MIGCIVGSLAPPMGQAQALEQEVHVLVPERDARVDAVLAALGGRFRRLTATDDASALRSLERSAVCIAVGPQALERLLVARTPANVVAAYISRQTYEASMSRFASGQPVATAVYAEPDPAHQLELIGTIYRSRVLVAAFVSRSTAEIGRAIESIARQRGLEAHVQQVAEPQALARHVGQLPAEAVILIFPDAALYTPVSLRELIEAGYRRRLPVIGFSAALVGAGAMASAYADARDIAAQVHEAVASGAVGRWPPPSHPRYWRVAINDKVARSLSVLITSKTRALGRRPP